MIASLIKLIASLISTDKDGMERRMRSRLYGSRLSLCARIGASPRARG